MKDYLRTNSEIQGLLEKYGYPKDTIRTVISFYSQPIINNKNKPT